MKKNTKLESTEQLLNFIQYLANEYYSGHYTIFSFTTCYKFSFMTITEREDINELLPYDNLKDALINGIQEHFSKMNKK